ncbi:MAG: amidohydrolase family protein [Robiginitomaculum sp.]|nr:amidohydrolase family protein [Robiginitomaculum sp.]MDQ7077102.1 amidohydrolase family protein [Robiginitomaculum sp.]
MYDLLIRGGTIVDGNGGQPYEGDLAIMDGKIAQIGTVDGAARQEIDAKGAIVTPGVIDVHTHYDGQAVWDADLAPSSWHGVTSVLMGNCGVGFAPLRPGDQDRLVSLMEGVEEIPGTALHEGLDWRWESFGDYMDRLDAIPHAINIATQIPHDPVRLFVMGDRAEAREVATEEDVEAMAALVHEGLKAGAFGFSTGRTDTHRTSDGHDTPASVAERRELEGLASAFQGVPYRILSAVSDFDMHDGEERFDPEFDILETMARIAGRPMTLSTMQRFLFPEQWKRIAGRIEGARASGLDMRMQVAPRGVGVLQGLRTTLNALVGKPSYRKIMDLPFEEKLKALHDPELRAKILSEERIRVSDVDPAAPPQIDQVLDNLDFLSARMFPLGDPPNYEPAPEESILARAQARGVDVLEELYDQMLSDHGETMIYFPIFNYNDGNLDVVHEMMSHPAAHLGLGDGGAHVGTIVDSAWSSFFLSHWTRDRVQGQGAQIPIERAIQMMSADQADFLGLKDRGRLVPGLAADINVIDMERLKVRRPHMIYDLPAGGRRLVQEAEGYIATLVAGVPILENDKLTGATPGRLLRAA